MQYDVGVLKIDLHHVLTDGDQRVVFGFIFHRHHALVVVVARGEDGFGVFSRVWGFKVRVLLDEVKWMMIQSLFSVFSEAYRGIVDCLCPSLSLFFLPINLASLA